MSPTEERGRASQWLRIPQTCSSACPRGVRGPSERSGLTDCDEYSTYGRFVLFVMSICPDTEADSANSPAALQRLHHWVQWQRVVTWSLPMLSSLRALRPVTFEPLDQEIPVALPPRRSVRGGTSPCLISRHEPREDDAWGPTSDRRKGFLFGEQGPLHEPGPGKHDYSRRLKGTRSTITLSSPGEPVCPRKTRPLQAGKSSGRSVGPVESDEREEEGERAPR